jgi:hypothetical protein
VGIRSSRQDLKAVGPGPRISRLRSLQVQRATRSPLLCRRPARDLGLAFEPGGGMRSVGASVTRQTLAYGFNHLVGECEQCIGNRDIECVGTRARRSLREPLAPPDVFQNGALIRRLQISKEGARHPALLLFGRGSRFWAFRFRTRSRWQASLQYSCGFAQLCPVVSNSADKPSRLIARDPIGTD